MTCTSAHAAPEAESAQLWQEQDDSNIEAVERMTQLLQRICNQNVQKDIVSDFKVCSSSSSHLGPQPRVP